ncbi:MAG TPA: hypothetical protein VER12_14545 [Polyangiaceae bacterium]|nr:hypothetical protein [Polyangiaceae bacterium]
MTWVTGLVAAACFWASTAHARPILRQECNALSPEDSARVEARLLASLLARDATEVTVSVACDHGIARVSASVGPEETRRSVSLSGSLDPDAIVALATRAVTQLLASADHPPAPAAPTEVAPPPAGTLDPVSPPPAMTPQTPSQSQTVSREPDATPAERTPTPPPCPANARNESRARADIALHTWGSKAALGAALGLEQETGNWSYAFLAGGTRPLEQPSLSTASEWTAAGEVSWQSAASLGIRFSAQLGLSLLTLSPDSGVISTPGTVKSAAFLDVNVSRPLWLGRFGLAPVIGLRAYSAKRAVTVEGQPELQISTPSVHVGVALLFRISN